MAASVDGEKYIQLEIGMPTSLLHAKRTGQRMADAFLERDVTEFLSPEALANVKFSKEHDDETGTLDELGPDAPHLLLPRQEGRMSRSFRERGISVDTAALQFAELLPGAENKLEGADWVLFPTAHALWALRELGWELPEQAQIAALGTTTRQVVEDIGRKVSVSPEGTASTPSLIEMFPEGSGRIVIPCADDLSGRLEEGLGAKGYEVVRMPVYHMVDVEKVADWVLEGWEGERYDAVLLTSPVVARSFLNVLPSNEQVAVFAWDEDTAEVLRKGGIEPAAVAPSKDDKGVVAIAEQITAVKR